MRPGDKVGIDGEHLVVSEPFYRADKYQRFQYVTIQCPCGTQFDARVYNARKVKSCSKCHLKARNLAAVRAIRKGSKASDGRKKCSRCLVEQNVDQFYKKSRAVDGLHSLCIECCRKTARNNKLYSKYGLTENQYLQMVSLQEDRCGICNLPAAEVTSANRPWNVDHCHKTGNVRGLLCSNCNTAIGMLRDSPLAALNAATYLIRHQFVAPVGVHS